jgi:hypothetical protein
LDTRGFRSTENFFRIGNYVYFLNEEQWIEVTNIISECKNLDTVKTTIKKNPQLITKEFVKSIEKAVTTITQDADNSIYVKIIKTLDINLISKLIVKSLNYQLIQYYSQDELKSNFTMSYTNLIGNLGNLIGQAYIKEELLTAGIDIIAVPDTTKRSSLYRKAQINEKILLNFVKKIENASITLNDYKATFGLIITEKEFEWLNAFLYLYQIEEGTIIIEKEVNLLKNKLKFTIENFVINIGNLIVNSLIEQKLLTKELHKKEVPTITLADKLEAYLYTSATFFKPSLVEKEVAVSKVHKLDDTMTITLDVDHRTVKHGNNVHLSAEPIMKTLLKRNSKMTIALKQYKEYLGYIIKIINKEFSIKDKDIQKYLWRYNLDFEKIYENTPAEDKGLIEKLARYGLEIDNYSSKSLLLQCENNPVAVKLYNRITGYKFQMKGLLNDANIYSRFNYFYIDRYATTTARSFSKPIFLGLQGSKSTKDFVIFKPTSLENITEKNFEKINKIIADNLTTPACKTAVQALTYATYQEKSKELYEQYILSFLKPGTDYTTFPIKESYINQIEWLSTRIKKPREMLLARLLITNYVNKENQSIIYELDATSSGLQLQGLMLKSNQLCEISNITGNQYTDIYGIFPKDFNERMEIADKFLISLLKQLKLPTIQELLKEEQVPNMKVANESVGKSIRYFLYCETIDLEILCKSIQKTLRTVKNIGVNLKIPNRIYFIKSKVERELSYELQKTGQGSYLVHLLLIARNIYQYHLSIAANPWITVTKCLNSRNMAKKPIMAYGYSMSSVGRKESWMEYFENTAYENGYSAVDKQGLIIISELLDRYFVTFEAEYLADSQAFLVIVKDYVKYATDRKEPMYFGNKYFKWEFGAYKTLLHRFRVTTKDKNKPQQITLYTPTNEVDVKKSATSLSSLFTHSGDAYLVYLYQELIFKILQELKVNNVFIDIGIYTNHDNFGINIEFAVYLKVILTECYNNFANSEYLKQLACENTKDALANIKNKPKIECDNTNFVKH